MLPDIVNLRFDASTHPRAAERVAAWANVMSLSVDVIVKPEDHQRFEARLAFYPLGSVLLVDSYATPQTVTRTKRTIARSGSEHVIFDMFLQGGFTGNVGGHPLTIAPGDGFVMDYRRNMRVQLSAARYIGVVMPRALWEEHAGRADMHGLRLEAASPEAQILGRLLQNMVEQVPAMAPGRAAALGIGLVAFIGASIKAQAHSATEESVKLVEPTLTRIRRYIERHASNPDLDATHLCSVFDLSRSGLYRACYPEGGVASLIRQRRTEIARAMLASATQSLRCDEEIAKASGFTGLRALKQALHDIFDTTPLRLRQAAASDPDVAYDQHRIEVGALLDR